MSHYNLLPFARLLREEDPLEMIDHLDDVLFFLVQCSDNDSRLSYRYYLLRALRNTIIEATKSVSHGD